MFVSQLIITVQMVLLFVVAVYAFKTIEAVSIAFVLEEAIAVFIVFTYLFKLLDTSLKDLLKSLIPSIITSLVLLAMLMVVCNILHTDSLILLLFIKFACFSVILVSGIQVFGIYDLRRFFKKA